MKTASKTAVITLLLVSVVGCRHNTNAAPPPQAQAPVGTPAQMTHISAMPPLPPPTPQDVAFGSPKEDNPPPPTPPKRTTHHRTAPAKPAAGDPAPATAEKPSATPQTQTASAANTSTEVSPIGQLSSTGEGTTSQGRHDIEQLITSIETGLNNIKRPLSTEEQTTSAQIKTFLTKAKQELVDNDLDGAQTLATKAKVLLEELTKK